MIFETEDSPFEDLENLPFSKDSWLNNWYPRICAFLDISSKEDSAALETSLTKISSNFTLENLRKIIENKRVIAIAPGIFLEKELDIYLQDKKKEGDVVISADGATSYLLLKQLIPNIIVSDLDGNAEHQLQAQRRGSILLIHIHGDNYMKIESYFSEISSSDFLITTQIQPLENSYNFYGFTDGDRIVCLSTFMKANEIVLIGYDFGTEIGKYSKKQPMNEETMSRKMKKFTVGKSVINWCAKTGQKIIFLADS